MDSEYTIMIPKYYGELKMGESHCYHNVFAHVAGYFKRFNFYAYHFLASVFANWYYDEYHKSHDKTIYLLSIFGIEMEEGNAGSYDEFVEKIRTSLMNKLPVVILLPDYTTDFFWAYKQEKYSRESHLYIICGMKNDNLVALKYNYTDNDLLNFLNSTPLMDICCTTEQLYKNYIEGLKFKGNRGCKLFFFKSGKSDENNYFNDLFKMISIFRKIDMRNSLLSAIILRDNYNYNAGVLIRDFCRFNAIKNILLPMTKILGKDDLGKEIENLLDEYETKRKIIVNKLIKTLYSNDNNAIHKIREEALPIIESYDSRISKYIDEIIYCCNSFRNSTPKGCINYASGAKVTVDSEAVLDVLPHSVFSGERLVNGRYEDFNNDAWCSAGESADHWAIIEIRDCNSINKIVIRHRFDCEGVFITKDFSLYCSLDGVEWVKVDEVHNNELGTTVHTFEPTKCKFIKLTINDPGILDNRARIFEIEAYGL
ncbi:MAG TPA: discoidin domain-containing protein [Clostridia bacterium]|nr:discoidin domain-containing protein [Clostridia bacterium]